MLRSRAAPAIIAGVAAVAIVAIGWRCPIQLATGHPCPTCGVTRAVRLALRGDLDMSLRTHPLWWLAVPVATGFIAVEVIGYARTRTWGASARVRGSNVVMLVTASLLFALWIARFAGFFGGPVQ